MKKILLFLTILFGMAGTASAQDLNSYVGKYSFDLFYYMPFKDVILSESHVMDSDNDFSNSMKLLAKGVSIPTVIQDNMVIVRACQPHFCNETFTVWAFDNERYYGSYVENGEVHVYGNPPDDIKSLMIK